MKRIVPHPKSPERLLWHRRRIGDQSLRPELILQMIDKIEMQKLLHGGIRQLEARGAFQQLLPVALSQLDIKWGSLSFCDCIMAGIQIVHPISLRLNLQDIAHRMILQRRQRVLFALKGVPRALEHQFHSGNARRNDGLIMHERIVCLHPISRSSPFFRSLRLS